MPKPINKTWGHCRCRVSGCDALADVRRMKSHERGAQYLVCPAHGPDKAQGAGPQAALDAWIDEHQIPDQDAAALELGQDAPEPTTAPAPEPKPIQVKPATAPHGPKPAPAPAPAPGRKPGRFLSWIKTAHEDFSSW